MTTDHDPAASGAADPPPGDRYTHGHHASVLRSHRWRTVENSAGYLFEDLVPGASVLDVGCGPGTISCDIAHRVKPGEVVGVDRSQAVIDLARQEAARRGTSGVRFDVADAYQLPFADGSFDVVHAHQVLQHVTDPVAVLREMRRVCRPGGVVGVRESDYPAKTWFPEPEGLDRWMACYLAVARGNGAEPAAGRRLLHWVHRAGFDDVRPSCSVWCFATPADRAFWGGLWAERTVASDFASQALEAGLATAADLDEMAAAWRMWAADPDGWMIVPGAEVRCVR